jgi:hypothetical protein
MRRRLVSQVLLEVRSYLRAAQAYMLISMPTATSTIFGAFHAIFVSHEFAARTLLGVTLVPAQRFANCFVKTKWRL